MSKDDQGTYTANKRYLSGMKKAIREYNETHKEKKKGK